MASHGWIARQHEAQVGRNDHATAAVLVETGAAWQGGGCGSSGDFGGGAVLALPLLLAAVLLRRIARRER